MLRKIYFAVVGVLLMATPVAAQNQPGAGDRVATQIGTMFIQMEHQRDQIANLQDQIAKAQARIKELEAKQESKKE